AGNYLFAMRTGGYFVASTGGNNLLNTVSLSGLGDFSGSGSVSVPIDPTLTMQVGSPTSTAVSFSLSQIQAYNSFPCDNGLGLVPYPLFNVWMFRIRSPSVHVLTLPLVARLFSSCFSAPGLRAGWGRNRASKKNNKL